ncbi:MAG: AAA family ATPase [Burkholderiales bacterium]
MTDRLLLNDLLTTHFAPVPLEELVVTRRDFAHWMRPDLQKALEALFAALPGCRFSGGRVRSRDFDFRFADLVEARTKAIVSAPAVYQDVDVGEEKPVRCLTRGLWLAQRDGVAFALLLDVTEYYGRVRARVEIAVGSGDASAQLAAEVMARLVREAEGGASWRGKMLVLKPADDDYDIASPGPQVEKAASVRREDIVLPEATLALIERNTICFARCADQLVCLGLSGKKGVLLYGPPGTGKTTVVRWLVGELTDYTKLIVAGADYLLLQDTLVMARLLQPALVVLEDVDLVGGDRDGPYAAGKVLNLLLNEMDGLARDARVLFVLTTNRPEVLEPALAARPGRIDQAIEVGLPDEAERALLVKRYAGALEVDDGVAVHAARRVGRVSPAFIKELMRRAAQAMLERGGGDTLEKCDVESALNDMLGAGRQLGARMFGAGSRIGFTAGVGRE